MAQITKITKRGYDLVLSRDDGTQVIAPYCGNSDWLPPFDKGGSNQPKGPEGSETANGKLVTAQMIEAAVNSAGSPVSAMIASSQAIADSFNDAINKLAPGDFMSKPRLACLVGECAQETDWFKTLAEYGGPSTSYAPYYGRGMIQLTLQSNYSGFSSWLSDKGIENNIMGDLDSVAQLPFGAYAAVYYFVTHSWDGRNLAQWCDDVAGDWDRIGAAINRGNPDAGAPLGAASRRRAIDAVLAVTPDPTASSGGGGGGQKAAEWMLAHIGAFYYSQDSWVRSHMDESGGGDCSSTVITAYVDTGTPADVLGGLGWTGTLAGAGTPVPLDESQMHVGDLILITWEGYNPTYDHVEMILGNNQTVGHGGPGKGPNVHSLSNIIASSSMHDVRRYV